MSDQDKPQIVDKPPPDYDGWSKEALIAALAAERGSKHDVMVKYEAALAAEREWQQEVLNKLAADNRTLVDALKSLRTGMACYNKKGTQRQRDFIDAALESLRLKK